MEKLKTKTKKPKLVIEEKTHPFVFSLPVVIALAMLVYMITGKTDTNFFIYILVLLVIFLKSLSLFYRKKIVVSDKKIYIYIRGKKFISWSLDKDFNIVNYSQSFLGKIFNFGSLTLINNNKEMYEYYFLRNPAHVYSTIITTYEALMKKLDPSFIVSYIDKEDNSGIDSLNKPNNNDEK